MNIEEKEKKDDVSWREFFLMVKTILFTAFLMTLFTFIYSLIIIW